MALKGYGQYTPEAAEAEKAEVDKVFGAKIIKFKVGRTAIRILPPKEGQQTPFKMIYMHFVDLPADDKPAVFPCPRRMANKPCPVCAKAEELRASGDEGLVEKAKKLFAKRQWYANAIDRKNVEEGVQLVAFGKEIMNQVVGIRKTLAEDGLDFTDPYEGYDIVVERTGTGKEDTEYTVQARLKPSQLGDDDEQMQGWLDSMIDLEQKATPPTSEEIMRRLKGEKPSESSEDRKAMRSGGKRDDDGQRSLPRGRTAEDDAEDPSDGDDFGDSDGDSDSDGDAVNW